MADGTIRFDTEIDNSKIEKALNSILKTVQAFSGNSSKAFKEVDESAEKISDTMSKVADSVNQRAIWKSLQSNGTTSTHR